MKGVPWLGTVLLLGVEALAGGSVRFTDATEEFGLDFVHYNAFSAERRLVETMGGGGALFDMDNDGDLDLYLVQGNDLPTGDPKRTNRLYENRNGRLIDITEGSGAGDPGYGMGAVAGDYDNDGDLDLYVTNFGPNVLLENRGNGTFQDVTARAGVGTPLLSTSAAFADYDQDGDLDLYVCNYVRYSLETEVPCSFGGMRIYCGPNEYAGTADVLYRNNGDGTFSEVTRSAGVYEPTTRGLGVVWADVNNDRWPDIYVANDMTPNLLFINQGDGTFREEGVLRGVAFNGDGIANGSMGVDAGDYDNDGDLDLWVTNFSLEPNTLMNNEDGFFYDATFLAGLGEPSFLPLGFGTRFVDVDNDGWLDLMVGNGHIWDNVDRIDPKLSYAQPVQLFLNQGDGTFQEYTREAGLAEGRYVVRGMLFGDLENDGDVDVILCQSGRQAVILRNEGVPENHWLSVRLVGAGGNRDQIGARVFLEAGPLRQMREVVSGASYLSGNDLRLHFGLGGNAWVDRLRVLWSDGTESELHQVAADRILIVHQGGLSKR
ncbi:MAG: RNA-binding protein [Candidatus Poribacteria bacterium]|nr:MAG: RNA-binding protein [Candidatus Poribacteria bacterium]